MLRLSKLTDYAVVVLVRLGRDGRRADLARDRGRDRHSRTDRRQGAEDVGRERSGVIAARRPGRLPAEPQLGRHPDRRCHRRRRRPDRPDRLRRGIAVRMRISRACARCAGDGIRSTRPSTRRYPPSRWPTCRSHCYLPFAFRLPASLQARPSARLPSVGRRIGSFMAAVTETLDTVQSVTQSGYKWGFETTIEMDFAPKGLNEDIIRLISARKEEPEWMLEWRLKAYAAWLKMEEPHWARVDHPPIDYQDLHYYAAPKKKARPEKPRRGRSRTAEDVREARHSAEGTGDPGRRRSRHASRTPRSPWMRCSTASPSPPRSRRRCARPA